MCLTVIRGGSFKEKVKAQWDHKDNRLMQRYWSSYSRRPWRDYNLQEKVMLSASKKLGWLGPWSWVSSFQKSWKMHLCCLNQQVCNISQPEPRCIYLTYCKFGKSQIKLLVFKWTNLQLIWANIEETNEMYGSSVFGSIRNYQMVPFLYPHKQKIGIVLVSHPHQYLMLVF